MKPDPLVDEIRKTRHEISAEFQHDPRRLFRHLQAFERRLRKTGKFRFVHGSSQPARAQRG